MSKVGLLVECGRDGLEVHVCLRICELLVDVSGKPPVPTIVPMDNKAILLEECGTVARRLLDDGCERVVILWDERPKWGGTGKKLCWLPERPKILGELIQTGRTDTQVHLMCIEREF